MRLLCLHHARKHARTHARTHARVVKLCETVGGTLGGEGNRQRACGQEVRGERPFGLGVNGLGVHVAGSPQGPRLTDDVT